MKTPASGGGAAPYAPITVAEVRAFRQERYEASLALVEKKGHDYNRQQQNGGDTLFNLRVCELLGIVETTEAGILTRLSDKLMRLVSLTAAPGVEAAVSDEPVMATVDDVHNYVDYLALVYRKRRERAAPAARTVCDHPGGLATPCGPSVPDATGV